MTRKTISILGSTGSVGHSTIDLIKSAPDKFNVKVLSAYRNADLLIEQAKSLKPEIVAIADETFYKTVKDALPSVQVLSGAQGVEEAASTSVDLTMAAIVGMAGLKPVMHALRNSKAVAIANKEPLVSAGTLLLNEAKNHGTKILPVDSEHNAIFQVFDETNRAGITKIILTASGGPFRTWTPEQMRAATPEQAVAHPNWSMGAKISVDSASMMNKGLEVIEAHHLFQIPADQIDVILHPQSVIHSMVEYADGSVLAQLGAPDMRTPIAYALGYPNRMATSGQRLDWKTLKQLDFGAMNFEQFPCLAMAYEALRAGQAHCVALNATNEVAVEHFLNRKIGFTDISRLIRAILDDNHPGRLDSLDEIVAYDKAIKEKVRALIS